MSNSLKQHTEGSQPPSARYEIKSRSIQKQSMKPDDSMSCHRVTSLMAAMDDITSYQEPVICSRRYADNELNKYFDFDESTDSFENSWGSNSVDSFEITSQRIPRSSPQNRTGCESEYASDDQSEGHDGEGLYMDYVLPLR